MISNQIRKAIRRKHTLPNYKLRYKPFFHKTIDEDFDLTEVQLNGKLDINVAELTRLSFPCHINHVFCTLTMAPIAWVTARQNDEQTIVCVLDIEIHKAKNQQIGIVFKQTEQSAMIDAVILNTPAMKAKLCKGDILISIEGKKINNINNIAKIIKGLNRPVFTIRIERIIGGVIKNDLELPNLLGIDLDDDTYEVINDMNISFSKTAETVQIGGKARQNSIDRVSSDSSRSNTPTSSPCKIKDNFLTKARSRTLSRNNSEPKVSNTAETGSLKFTKSNSINSKKDSDSGGADQLAENEYQMHTTVECLVNSFISMNDLCQFKLNKNSMYLNLNVFGRCNDDTILLGYMNIPVHSVLFECNDSTLGHFVKQYTLSPPDTPNL